MVIYRRNLPHWHPDGAAIFLTWRLYGSLPVSPKSTARIGCATKPSLAKDSPGRKFKLMDSVLDKATNGPLWLKDPRIAQCVLDASYFGENRLSFYALHAFVIMPNHVHLLITPKVPIPRLMNGLKGVTAREANAILGRQGKHFWQDESFDHWVRTSTEFDRIRAYIEFNPVSARLAAEPEAWPWSSASQSIPHLLSIPGSG
jgi:putative transposase